MKNSYNDWITWMDYGLKNWLKERIDSGIPFENIYTEFKKYFDELIEDIRNVLSKNYKVKKFHNNAVILKNIDKKSMNERNYQLA